MNTSDPLQILLSHDQWATRQILIACSALTPAQFHHPFEMGPGSLHNTLTHILGAIRGWTETLASIPRSPRLEEDNQNRTPADLLTLATPIYQSFNAEASRLPLDQLCSRVRNGQTHHFSRGAILTHVTTHSMHHRAQCLNMLRHLGIQALPPSSVTEWTLAVSP